VCVLNRLEVPVRAGIISRVHGVPFSDFEARLFKPLEHVVEVRRDPVLRDMLYEARHPLIAQMVFENILLNRAERFDIYVRLLGALNVSYSTDRAAFRHMVRGRVVGELFPDLSEATELYRVAMDVAPDDGYLFQQMAIHEMNRANGNLTTAHGLLAKARELLPRDTSVLHSMAELARRRAGMARAPVERDELRREARELAARVRDEPDSGAAGYDTLLKLSLDRLRELLDDSDSTSTDLGAAIESAEHNLDRGLQRYPGDPTLQAREAELATLLKDQDRVVVALEAAFKSNRRATSVAVQLAQALEARGDDEGAEWVLKEALEANRSDKRINGKLAKQLMKSESPDIDSIIYYARRSYTDGDDNYDAQFWYAAWCFIRGQTEDLQTSVGLFGRLRQLRQSHERRTAIRWEPTNLGQLQGLGGRIARLETTFGWVTRDGPADDIFFHEANSRVSWPSLKRSQRVRFSVAFTLSGAVAVDVTPE